MKVKFNIKSNLRWILTIVFVLTIIIKLLAQSPDPKEPEKEKNEFPQGPQGGPPTPPVPIDPDSLIFISIGAGLGILYARKRTVQRKKTQNDKSALSLDY